MGDSLFTLEKTEKMYVDFSIPSRNQSKVSLGQKVHLSLDAYPNKDFKGKVTAIDNVIATDANSLNVRSTFDNVDKKLIGGDLGNVKLTTNIDKDLIIVPNMAVVYDNNEAYIFTVNLIKDPKSVDLGLIANKLGLVNKDSILGKVTKNKVSVGGEVGQNDIIINSGIKAGDSIVTAGANKLDNNMTVVISNP